MRSTTLLKMLSVISAIFYSVSSRGATFTVANGDVAGFKAAVQAANATLAADTISLAINGDYSFSTYHPTSNPLDRTALPRITTAITIEGNGSVIRRADSIAFPVTAFRLLRVSARGGALTLRSATVRNGDLAAVNGDWADSEGSGLRNDGGTITIENCRFDKNHSSHWAAGIYTTGPTVVTDSKFVDNSSFDGTGGIRAKDASSLILERCQFSENNGDETIRIYNVQDAEISQCSVVKAGSGGANFGRGIYVADSTLRIANCTITEGSSTGLYIYDSAVTMTHCTITEHGQANRPGIGILLDTGSLSLRNSILAFNENGPSGNADCKIYSGILLQNTGNLIRDGSCNPDFTGNPKLGALGFYGGTTRVFPLIQGSPAIGNGNDLYSEPIDQRGVARPIGANCDIGAYEGALREERKLTRLVVDLIYRSEPYIIICDPLPDEGIAVSVAGTKSLSVRSIDAASLTMGNTRSGSARVIGIGDVNRDGIEDLTVEFRLADVYGGAFGCEDVSLLEMQGQTGAGQPIVGYVNVAAAER